jgi:hypothetical protein
VAKQVHVALIERLKASPMLVFCGVVVIIMVAFALVQLRGSQKMNTADNIRQVKKILEIYEGENGGFPANLAVAEQRYGPLPSHVRSDSWGRAIEYTASKPYPGATESGQTLYAECELRSAGPNERPGDGDDLVWQGVAGRGGP